MVPRHGPRSAHEGDVPAVAGADVIVGALAPRGPLADRFRDVYATLARLAAKENASLYIVGGFSSLRPAAGAQPFVELLSGLPPELEHELVTLTAVVAEDLPATPESPNWIFASPAQGFGAFAPGEQKGTHRLGDDVALAPKMVAPSPAPTTLSASST